MQPGGHIVSSMYTIKVYLQVCGRWHAHLAALEAFSGLLLTVDEFPTRMTAMWNSPVLQINSFFKLKSEGESSDLDTV